MSFCLGNIGSGSTTNLVGTLQNTGGVTGASGPQTYGAVAPGATVCKPFTFTATGTCGGTLTATIHLQDGANDLGNAVFNFTLGCLVTTIRLFPDLRRRRRSGASRRLDDDGQRCRISVGDVNDHPLQRAERCLRAGAGHPRPRGTDQSDHRGAGRLAAGDFQEQLQHREHVRRHGAGDQHRRRRLPGHPRRRRKLHCRRLQQHHLNRSTRIRSPDVPPGPATPAAISPRRRTCRPRPAGRTSS